MFSKISAISPQNHGLPSTLTYVTCYICVCLGACLAGRYLDDELNECILCPIATYQNEVAQADCIPCEDGLVTEEEGSISEDMCKGKTCDEL